ncbi:MAG TPA: DUF1648 domain-containing protein [Chthonomonadaceae bacterium]|nr:DUF1648 domain-containing protein [Chthonomonadaceae bacterium]
MRTWQAVALGMLLTGAILLYSLALYPHLPDLIPIHWDWHGRVDGWADKRWAIFLMPGTMLLILGAMVALPALSPRRFQIEPFAGTFNYLMLVTCGLMGYLQIVMLQSALHPEADMGRVLVAGIFLFLGLMGNVLGRTRRNFWMGIRTPWTLASDTVWIATHRLAGKLLVAAGVFGVVAILLGVPLPLCFIGLMCALLIPALYSYVLYQRLEGGGPVG